MYALSIKQPWASLISSGQKTAEIRSWQTQYRGPLVICASAKKHINHDGPYGCLISIVELVDIVPFTRDLCGAACIDWIKNHYAWRINVVVNLPPIQVRGQLKLFKLPHPITSALHRYPTVAQYIRALRSVA